MSKRFGGIIDRLQRQNLFISISTGSPMVVTLGQQYNTGEKPAVILFKEKSELLLLTTERWSWVGDSNLSRSTFDEPL